MLAQHASDLLDQTRYLFVGHGGFTVCQYIVSGHERDDLFHSLPVLIEQSHGGESLDRTATPTEYLQRPNGWIRALERRTLGYPTSFFVAQGLRAAWVASRVGPSGGSSTAPS